MRLLLILAAAAITGCGGSPSAPEDVKSLIVVGTPPTIGASTQFTALAVHSDGTTAPATSHVVWTSSNTAVATVKDDGTVTGVVYFNTTNVLYTITGIGSGASAFVLQDTVGSPFGTGFTPVRNAQDATPLDALVIRLTNPGATCCVNASNGMGLDNIVLAR